MLVRIIELFAGIGACSTALKRIGIDIEIVDAVEIDKYAIASFNAIHNTNFEIQDVKEWNKDLKDIDLITHGSPCQDFSVAGKQAGGDFGSGTRSSLMYETIRIVERIKPKYVLWENVKNILSVKHKHNFESYLKEMENLGYKNYYQVLNAKDYGIPQNRERVYTISIRNDIETKNFIFPGKEELKLRLKDMLEDEVDEKYYLDDTKIQNITKDYKDNKDIELPGAYGRDFGSKGKLQSEVCDTLTASMGTGGGNVPIVKRIGNIYGEDKGTGYAGNVWDKKGLCPTLTNMQGGNRQPMIINEKILIKNATKKGYEEADNGDSVNLSYPNSKTRRGRVGHKVSQTLQCNDRMGVISNLRIRKLTPKECWRLMGFADEDFKKAKSVPMSNTQLYKQAGNSIVVNVLEKIFRNLFTRNADEERIINAIEEIKKEGYYDFEGMR